MFIPTWIVVLIVVVLVAGIAIWRIFSVQKSDWAADIRAMGVVVLAVIAYLVYLMGHFAEWWG